MIKRLKELFNKYFDYDIVGWYYDSDGKGHKYKKYLKRYKWRKTNK